MAQLGYSANPAQDAEGHRGEFVVVEPGWKTVVITASVVKPTKAGDGKLLELTEEIQDGTGRTLTDRLNIVNPNEVAQRIGRGALGKIALACGVNGALADTNVLHGRPFEVLVTVEEFESNTEAGKRLKSNKITDYRAVKSATPTAAGSSKPIGW